VSRRLVFAFALLAFLCPAASVQAECVWGNCQTGRGTFRHPDGSMETGIWQDGKLVISKGRSDPVQPPRESAKPESAPEPEPRSRDASGGRSCVRGDCIHGAGLRAYRDGSHYEGDFVNGLRQGRGVLVSKQGHRYEGSWAADRRHGFGVQVYPDGEYRGSWYKGTPTREGVRSYTNGDRYVGEYRGSRRHGQGTLTYANGDRYVGAFEDDQPHGDGKWYAQSGSVKEGHWSRGRYMGRDGRVAAHALVAGGQGCISGNCWDGRGRYVYEDGSEYVGSFASGHPHGPGSITYADGRVDSGRWEKGERIGRRVIATPGAVASWRAQSKSSHGCRSGDCRNGTGVYRWRDGSSYAGGFRDSRPDGQGTWEHPDGARYQGEWKLGVRHGRGSERTATGLLREGVWQDGSLRDAATASAPRARKLRLHWPDLSRAASGPKDGEEDAAIVVGIEGYAHVAPIPGALDNATAWYEYFVRTRGVPVERVSLLLDEDATREDIQWAVDQAVKQVGDDGTLWFVFIGHGAPARDGRDGLLVGYDAQQKARSVQARSLGRGDLLARLESSQAEHVHVLLDACFSGRAGDGSELVAGLQPLVVTQEGESSDPRTALFTAAGSDEFAGPLPGAERPAFSYLALGALRGWADGDGDGAVTAAELHGYVETALRVLVRDRRQRNTFAGAPDARMSRKAREKGPELSSLAIALAKSSESR
jgi:hypothetical protein